MLVKGRNQFSASWNAPLRHQMKTAANFEELFGWALDCIELYTQAIG